MTFIDTITTRSLLGTSRDTGALPPAPDALAEILPESPTVESAILRGAASWYLYERAGRLPVKRVSTPFETVPDQRALCSKRAADWSVSA